MKSIEVEHTQEVFIVATGGIVIRGGVTRKVLIQMPGGGYDPAHAECPISARRDRRGKFERRATILGCTFSLFAAVLILCGWLSPTVSDFPYYGRRPRCAAPAEPGLPQRAGRGMAPRLELVTNILSNNVNFCLLSFERIGPAPAFGSLGIYEMQSGSASLTVSGETRRGEPEYTCQVDGQMSFSELGKLGSILVRVQSDESAQLPYEYSLEVFLPGTVAPEEGPLEDKVTIEFSNCGEKSDELDGTTDEIPAAWDLVLFENQPSDGVTFAGSIEEVVGSVTREKHWSLHGSP